MAKARRINFKKFIYSITAFLCLFSGAACSDPVKSIKTRAENNAEPHTQQTIETAFAVPQGYARTMHDKNSFAAYLRSLPLHPKGTLAKYYNGREKPSKNIYIRVINMPVGKRDLQQCADAVMRLYGEYLYSKKRYGEIKFNFVSDGKPRYYTDYAKEDYSYAKFLKYMDYVFAYANTASLHNELKPVNNINDIMPGDVFIQKGRPFGHAVIVIDTAVNKAGAKVFMLAQSYMPAQETQILINPNNSELSPWYEAKKGAVKTPEWNFTDADLRRF